MERQTDVSKTEAPKSVLNVLATWRGNMALWPREARFLAVLIEQDVRKHEEIVTKGHQAQLTYNW